MDGQKPNDVTPNGHDDYSRPATPIPTAEWVNPTVVSPQEPLTPDTTVAASLPAVDEQQFATSASMPVTPLAEQAAHHPEAPPQPMHTEYDTQRPSFNVPAELPPPDTVPEAEPDFAQQQTFQNQAASYEDTQDYTTSNVVDAQAYDVDVLPQNADMVWTASEFIEHPKTMQWYAILAGITVVLLVIGFIVTHHDIFTMVVILLCAGIFGYMASRQPRQLSYALSSTGVMIAEKFYPYKDFSAFAIVQEDHFASIDLLPLKRFAPMLSIYFEPAREEQILDVLTQHLPLAEHKRNAVDSLMHKIGF